MHWLNRLEQLFAISTLSNPPFFSVCVCSHRRAQPSSASSFTAKTAPFSYEGLAAISDTVELPDGRDLGFARYGNKDGPQTFYLHGLPGSRVEGGVFFEQAAKHLGAGIIFIDRPSVGLSSPHPHRTITDHAQDVLHLARHLDLKAWRVIGVSGGGPYALACARHHPPECLRGVAVCAGIGPYELGVNGMGIPNRIIWRIFRYVPWILHIIYRPFVAMENLLTDDKLVDAIRKAVANPSRLVQIEDKDREFFKDEERIRAVIASAREHRRQGFEGFLQEGRTLARDWDLKLEDISFRPIQLWYGRQDVNVPMYMGEGMARQMGDGVELHIMEETHISLVFNRAEEILRRLLRRSEVHDKDENDKSLI